MPTTYPVHLGPMTARSASRGSVTFKPTKKVAWEGPVPNPAVSLGTPFAARIFVGLKVGNTVKWTTKDVVKVVWEERKKQKRSSGASFLRQEGIYEQGGQRIVEPSIQIVILDFDGLSEKAFTKDMVHLGEALARRLEQNEVIVEIQRRGIARAIYSVVA